MTQREKIKLYLGFSTDVKYITWSNISLGKLTSNLIMKIEMEKHIISRHFLLTLFFYHLVSCKVVS